MPDQSPALNGLVLAGGKSSRMGKEKAFLNYYGQPQVDYMHQLLSQFVDNVYLSCKNEQLNLSERPNAIIDQFSFESPLNGLLSAFCKVPDCAWIMVACDMPFIDKALLLQLIQNRDPKKLATCFYDSEGSRPEPLLTIWEPSCYTILKSYPNRGIISPRKFLMDEDVQIVTTKDIEKLANINTVEDYNLIKKIFSENTNSHKDK